MPLARKLSNEFPLALALAVALVLSAAVEVVVLPAPAVDLVALSGLLLYIITPSLSVATVDVVAVVAVVDGSRW